MGDSLLVGGGAGGGVRTKSITWDAYQMLSDTDKNNPYVKWLITDRDASEFISKYGVNLAPVCTTWEGYCNSSVDEQLDPGTLWVIVDMDVEDLAALGIDVSSGSKYYTIEGATSDIAAVNIAGSTVYGKSVNSLYTLETAMNEITELKETIAELKSALGLE